MATKRGRPSTGSTTSPNKKRKSIKHVPLVDEPLSFSLRRVPNLHSYKAQQNETEPQSLVSGFDESIDTGYYTVTPRETWEALKKYKKFTSEH
jgi:hypothetical protein